MLAIWLKHSEYVWASEGSKAILADRQGIFTYVVYVQWRCSINQYVVHHDPWNAHRISVTILATGMPKSFQVIDHINIEAHESIANSLITIWCLLYTNCVY